MTSYQLLLIGDSLYTGPADVISSDFCCTLNEAAMLSGIYQHFSSVAFGIFFWVCFHLVLKYPEQTLVANRRSDNQAHFTQRPARCAEVRAGFPSFILHTTTFCHILVSTTTAGMASRKRCLKACAIFPYLYHSLCQDDKDKESSWPRFVLLPSLCR